MIDPPSLRLNCPGCSREYLLDPSLVPPGGARVLCRRCGTRFVVQRPGAEAGEPGRETVTVAPDADGGHTPVATTWPQLPPRSSRAPAPARRRAWLFPEDPAMSREGVLPALQQALRAWSLEIVDADRRAELTQAAQERSEWPDLVVFGDMQVLLEDRLLQAVASRTGVLRVLISTHHNPELIEAASAYCGFDRHLVLPLTPAAVEQALSQSL
ncbi:MAG: zinc-ribbon domain-containing protein [Myxococcota bacterium]